MKKDKIIPDFKNEDEEREFWATHSPRKTDFFRAWIATYGFQKEGA